MGEPHLTWTNCSTICWLRKNLESQLRRRILVHISAKYWLILRHGEIFNDCFVAQLLLCLPEMESWKSISISSVLVSGNSVDIVESFVYLGSEIHTTGSSECEVRRRIGLAKNCFNQLNRGIWHSSISISTKVQLYRVYIQPILLYGSETRALTQALEDRIAAFDNTCLRRILRIPYTVHATTAEVRLRAGSPPQLLLLIQTRRLCFFGHVARMGDSQDTSRALYTSIRGLLEAPPRTSTSHLATDHGSRPPAAQSRSELSLVTRSGPRTMEATRGNGYAPVRGMPAMMMMNQYLAKICTRVRCFISNSRCSSCGTSGSSSSSSSILYLQICTGTDSLSYNEWCLWRMLCLGAFWLYSGFALIGMITFALCLPETKGKHLEEVEQLFSDPLISCRRCCNGAYNRMSEWWRLLCCCGFYLPYNVQCGTWESGTHMLYIDQAIRQFWKQLASIIAVKCGRVEHCVQLFNVTTIHCNDWG